MRGGCGSAVSGRGRRARMRGIGRAEAVLHIRLGPAGDGSAESRGNSPALNAVEILPCAKGPSLHMGVRPLKTNILGKPRNHAEDSESTRGGAPLQCATPPHGPGGTRPARERPAGAGAQEERSGRNPTRPAAPLHQSPATRRTAARRAVPEP